MGQDVADGLTKRATSLDVVMRGSAHIAHLREECVMRDTEARKPRNIWSSEEGIPSQIRSCFDDPQPWVPLRQHLLCLLNAFYYNLAHTMESTVVRKQLAYLTA
jgi:hypothetical protein